MNLSIAINNTVLKCMPGTETIYTASDTVISNDPQYKLLFPEEYLISVTTEMPPYELKLKLGSIRMVLRNLANSNRLWNEQNW